MKIKKVISFLTAVLFIINQFGTPALSASQIGLSNAKAPFAFQINLPPDLGTIEEFRAGSSGKTIIYIQDAHDSLEAQENIARIINYMVEHYGAKTVFEEGYEGPVPTDQYFSFVKDPAIKEKISYFLMDKLRLGGAEYAHVNRKKDFKLIGADSIKLHLANIKQYQESAKNKAETEKDLDAIGKEIKRLADQHFPKELKEWMKLKERLDKNKLDLLAYLKRMSSLRPSLTTPKHINLLLRAADGKDQSAAQTVKEIDSKTLFQEIDLLEDGIAKHFLNTERDQRIFQHYKSIGLLKRLSDIHLSSDEYEAVKSRLHDLKTENFARFIVEITGKSIVLSKRWEQNIHNAIRFYEIAEERDQFVEKSLDGFLASPDEKLAVMVFGGFHKDRLWEILRQKKISCITVSPKISSMSKIHQRYYQELMSVGHLPFEPSSNVRMAAPPGRAVEIISNPPSYLLALPDNVFSKELKAAIRSEMRSLKLPTEIKELVLKKLEPYLKASMHPRNYHQKMALTVLPSLEPNHLLSFYNKRAQKMGITLAQYRDFWSEEDSPEQIQELEFISKTMDYFGSRLQVNYPMRNFEGYPAIREGVKEISLRNLNIKNEDRKPLVFRFLALGDGHEIENITEMLDQILQELHMERGRENLSELAKALKLQFKFYDIRSEKLKTAERVLTGLKEKYSWLNPETSYEFFNVRYQDFYEDWESASTAFVIARNIFKDQMGPDSAFFAFAARMSEALADGGLLITNLKDSNWIHQLKVDPLLQQQLLSREMLSNINKLEFIEDKVGSGQSPMSSLVNDDSMIGVIRRTVRSEVRERNEVYLNAEVDSKGKLIRGKFYRAFPTGIRGDLLEELAGTSKPFLVIKNMELDSQAGLVFGHKVKKFGLKGYENATGITAVFKGTNVYFLYDNKGNLIYERSENAKDPINVYVDAVLKDGKLVKGKEVGKFLRISEDFYKQYPDSVMTDVRLNKKGGLYLGKLIWLNKKGYEYAKGVTLVLEGSEVVRAYDKKGILIYESKGDFLEEKGAFYAKGRVANGKRIGGRLVRYYKELPEKILSENPDSIFYKSLDAEGGLFINKEKLWEQKPGYENAKVMIVFRDKQVRAVYDEKGQKIYSGKIPGEKKTNRAYQGAEIKKGKRVGGTFLKSFPSGIPKAFLESHDVVIFDQVKFGKEGSFSIGKRLMWKTKEGYENARNNVVYVKEGNVTAIYDKGGLLLYGEDVENPNNVSRNSVYLEGRIESGKWAGGKFYFALINGITEKFLAKHPNFILRNAKLTPQGGLYFSKNYVWRSLPGYENAEGILLRVENGEVIQAFDRNGVLIYGNGGDAIAGHFRELVDRRDIENLLRNFGVGGTYRILLRLHHFPPSVLKKLLNRHALETGFRDNEHLASGRNDNFSVLRMRQIQFPPTVPRGIEEILTDEIIQAIYSQVIEDSHFLEDVLAESKNPKSSEVLRNAYLKAYQYYKDEVGQKVIRWINQDAIVLKLYQRMGIHFLIKTKRAILADEPGLGKTIQAIAAALNIRNGQGAKKVLIIAPKSAKGLWRNEIETKTTGRQTIAVIEPQRFSKKKRKLIEDARFVIVSYRIIQGENNPIRQWLKTLGFDFIIVDEAHRMRNESFQTQALRDFNAEYKVLVTGTPLVGRKIGKLFNLLNWLYPELFPDREGFLAKYDRGEEGWADLKEDLRRFLIRRMKRYVSDIPPKQYTNIAVELNPKQRKVYQEIRLDFRGWLSRFSPDNPPPIPALLTKLTRLRQAAIHAGLVDAHSKTESSKYKELDKLLEQIHARGEKAVIFTNYVQVVKDLDHRYRDKGVHYLIGGEMSGRDRERSIENFKKSKQPELFISTIPAGGEAISLVSESEVPANNVIFVDKSWTPQERDQAVSRLHRIGQTHQVNVYSLIARNTIDEHIENLLMQGDWLFQFIFDEGLDGLLDDREFFDEMLKGLFYPEDVIDQLRRYRKDVQQGAGVSSEMDLFKGTEVAEDGSWIKFNSKSLAADFKIKSEGSLKVKSFDDLIAAIPQLDKNSKNLIRKFFKNQITDEIERKGPIKQSIVWKLGETLMPNMRRMDYHPETEEQVEISRLILDLLFRNPSLKTEDLHQQIGNDQALGRALYFLDANNFFMILSQLGVLDSQYFVRGDLLEYRPPLKTFVFDGKLRYEDEWIVEQIAPARRQPPIENLEPGFESEALQYRRLSREEEIRLAREAKKGNLTARTALYEANLFSVVALSKKALRIINNHVGNGAANALGLNDLYAVGAQELYRKVEGYWSEAEDISFDKYSKVYIRRAIQREVTQNLKVSRRERVSLDRELGGDKAGGVTFKDVLNDGKAQEETAPIPQDSGLIKLSSEILKAQGFRPKEIEAFLDSSQGKSVEEITTDTGMSQHKVKDIIQTAGEILRSSEDFLVAVNAEKQSSKRSEVRKSESRSERAENFQGKYVIVVDLNTFEALSTEQQVEFYKLFAARPDVKFSFYMNGDRQLTNVFSELTDLKKQYQNVEIRINPTDFNFQGRKVISVLKDGIAGSYVEFIEEKKKGSEDYYSIRYKNEAGLLTAALLLLDAGRDDLIHQQQYFSEIPASFRSEIRQLLDSFVYIARSA